MLAPLSDTRTRRQGGGGAKSARLLSVTLESDRFTVALRGITEGPAKSGVDERARDPIFTLRTLGSRSEGSPT